VTTVNGHPVTGHGGHDDDRSVARARRELRLSKALLALNPPHDLATILYTRAYALMRDLRRDGTIDPDTRQAADLGDDELHQAAGIVRELLALHNQKANGSAPRGLRVVLGSYALDLAHESDTRAGRDHQNL
jgi:hypothetical protein